MKLRLLSLITILCWSVATLHGQDLAGTWQGTLGQQRIVLTIARTADARFEGQLIAIDQGALPRTMTLDQEPVMQDSKCKMQTRARATVSFAF